MVDTKKRNKRQYQWQVDNTERINVLLSKGTKEQIRLAADRLGISASEFMRQAIKDKLEAVENTFDKTDGCGIMNSAEEQTF